MVQPPITKRRISEWDIKRLFNEGGFLKKIRNGKFRADSKRCNPVHPDNPIIGPTIPLGSISQTLYFYGTQNRKAIEIQRYIKPDGSLGASKKNDPKEILVGTVFYHRDQPTDRQPRLTNSEINSILRKRGLPALVTYLYYLKERYGKWKKDREISTIRKREE